MTLKVPTLDDFEHHYLTQIRAYAACLKAIRNMKKIVAERNQFQQELYEITERDRELLEDTIPKPQVELNPTIEALLNNRGTWSYPNS